jgi:RimJ/RimL family protein N-acetyltransferase
MIVHARLLSFVNATLALCDGVIKWLEAAMALRGEYFGSDPQRALQRRAAALWELVRDNPRYAFEGRCVGLHGLAAEDVLTFAALARTQGATVCFNVPAGGEAERTAAIEAQGLLTDRWDLLMGGERAIAACRAFIADYAPPKELTLVRAASDTPPALMQAMGETAAAKGVLPAAGEVLRGETHCGVCFFAVGEGERVAATAGAVMRNHPASDWADTAWWGMLATHDDWAGRGLALWLGALALVAMADEFGTKRFYTGVRSDNAPSQGLCRKLGLGDSGLVVLTAADPEAFGDQPLTK